MLKNNIATKGLQIKGTAIFFIFQSTCQNSIKTRELFYKFLKVFMDWNYIIFAYGYIHVYIKNSTLQVPSSECMFTLRVPSSEMANIHSEYGIFNVSETQEPQRIHGYIRKHKQYNYKTHECFNTYHYNFYYIIKKKVKIFIT